MGLVFDHVNFDGRAPELSRIADTVTKLCGLPVTLQLSDLAERGGFHDQHGHIAFACAPNEQLEIYSYKPGAVRKHYDEFTEGVELPIEKAVQGLHEQAGTQSIYLRGWVGMETLMAVTVLALESLGGRPRVPISDEMRREYGAPITEADLFERRRQLQKQLRRVGLIQILLLPVTFPIFVIGVFVRLATMPWRLRKAWKLTKDAISKRDHEKLLRSLPDDVEFTAANPVDYAALDQEGLCHYAETLEAQGFRHAADYSVRYPGHAMSNRPPGFARLWIHPVERCFAEVNQAFSEKRGPAPIGCTVVSWLEEGWDLSTSDREPQPINYAWRRPRSVWSRHPQVSPAELFAEHLRRRQHMLEALRIAVITELTPAAYFDHSRRSNTDRKEALRAKSIETIKEEMRRFKQSPLYEWSGELSLTACELL